MKNRLLVGAAEVDITPPVGDMMPGSLTPRKSLGVDDPLAARALVLESGKDLMAYVLLDLIALERGIGDQCAALASARTGIPAERIVWAASHTHTGPFTGQIFAAKKTKVINAKWLATLPERFAQAVEHAYRARQLAQMRRARGYSRGLAHNRRYKFKDGRAINTWLLHGGEDDVQCLGSAAPVDPELGIFSFDDAQGTPIAILWHFTLHTNSNFGPNFSADYPGVVAGRIRERFGPKTVSIFMPGACADINPLARHRAIGNELADIIISQWNVRKPIAGRIRLDAIKQEVDVSWRDAAADQDKRLKATQWPKNAQALFKKDQAIMKKMGKSASRTVIQAWRIGDVGFVSLPGELFVEWGLKIKAESPFPWTFPVELGGDYLGYLVTQQAWASGGYESITCQSAKPSAKGVAGMIDTALALLARLHAR